MRRATAERSLVRFLLFAGVLSTLAVAALSLRLGAQDGNARDQKPAPSSPPRYVFRESDDPGGTGKWFMGREIAKFMTYHGAEWLVRKEREDEEQPEKLLDALELQPGDTVADVGAGVGYFSLRMARRVGPDGKVLAVDIQEEMLEMLAQRKRKAGLENVEGILGTITDPKLPEGTVDLVLMVDVYHEFSHPVEMMRRIRAALKPDGRVVFVEYRGEDPDVPIKRLHKMTEAQVRKEAEALGLKWLKTLDFLPSQHVIVFRKSEPQADSD